MLTVARQVMCGSSRTHRRSNVARALPASLGALGVRVDLGNMLSQLRAEAADLPEERHLGLELLLHVEVEDGGGNRLCGRVVEGGEVRVGQRLLDGAALGRLQMQHGRQELDCRLGGRRVDVGQRLARRGRQGGNVLPCLRRHVPELRLVRSTQDGEDAIELLHVIRACI
eukprot:scaffold25360_cov122-Isochrysis_galbana.AAC.2